MTLSRIDVSNSLKCLLSVSIGTTINGSSMKLLLPVVLFIFFKMLHHSMKWNKHRNLWKHSIWVYNRFIENFRIRFQNDVAATNQIRFRILDKMSSDWVLAYSRNRYCLGKEKMNFLLNGWWKPNTSLLNVAWMLTKINHLRHETLKTFRRKEWILA